MPTCPWCVDPKAEDYSGALCIDHEAERAGLSVNQLIRRDQIEFEEASGT